MYGEPTVILAQRVTGEEEVPEGAVAVVTPDAPDVLSHVSVRARNMKVLFAICHDPEELAKVRPPPPCPPAPPRRRWRRRCRGAWHASWCRIRLAQTRLHDMDAAVASSESATLGHRLGVPADFL